MGRVLFVSSNTFTSFRMGFLKSTCLRKKSNVCCYVFADRCCEGLIWKDQWAWSLKRYAYESQRGAALPLTKRNCFSPISPVPCMRTGLLFLTSISYTDPDQFVYKTRPPRERPDTSPDVRMNSYLGLWPLRWQINCLGHGHLKKFFLIHTEHKSSYFLFHFKWNTKSMPWSSSAARGFSALGSIILPCSKLGGSSHHIFNSPHNLRTATVVVMLFINKTL